MTVVIPKIMPESMGISQMIQMKMLNLWKDAFIFSSFFRMTMVAHAAWNSIRRMASTPVTP